MPTPLIPDMAVFQRKLVTLPLVTYWAGESVLTAGSTTGRLLILKEGAVEVVREGVQIARLRHLVRGHRCRRPERHGALGFGQMLTNPGVPVHAGRNLLVPEYLKALRHESIANGTHAFAVCTRIGEENICHAAPHGGPPPLKWSDLRYVFDIQEDCNGKEAIQA